MSDSSVAAALICERVRQSIAVKDAMLGHGETLALVEELAACIGDALKAKHTVFFAGNGGSFADSMHLAAEFVGRFQLERPPLPAIALGANNSILTAIGNDYTFEDALKREVLALGRPGDVLVAISTSGRSENVVRAGVAGQDIGMHVYCLTGESGGRLKEIAPCICVPSTVTARIQEAHILIGHIVCELVEQELAEESNA